MREVGKGGKTVEILPLLTAAFAAGIALARAWQIPVIWLAALTLGTGLVLLGFTARRKQASVLLPAIFLLLGMLSLQVAEREIYASLETLTGRQVVLSGHVSRLEDDDAESAAFLFQVEQAAVSGAEPTKVRARIRVRVFRPPPELALDYGRRLRLSGDLLAPAGRRNPGGFDHASFLAGEGVAATMAIGGQAVEMLPGWSGSIWLGGAEAARRRAKEALTRWLPPPEAGLAAGLLLGETEQLAGKTREAYHRLGLAHLLSVSGLHTAFVAAFALLLTRRLRRRQLAAGLAAALVLGYVLLTGGEPPVWRAAIMLWLVLGARELGRETDGLRALAASALLMLFVRPHWLFGLSFQLSFLAVLGILLLSPRLQPHFSRLPSFLAGPLAVTLSAQLAVLPLQLSFFALLPLLTVPANLLSVPLVGVFMALGLAALLVSLFSPLLAAPFCLAAYPVLVMLNEAPKLLAALPWSAVQPPPLHPGLWVGYYLLLGLFVSGVKIRWTRARVVLVTLLALNLVVFSPVLGRLGGSIPLEVVFLDVGQGLSVFIRTPAGQNILVDAGGRPGSSFDPGERVVLPYLRSRRVASLDLLILTHPSEDHHGGMPAVLTGMGVRRFASNGDTTDTASFQAIRERLALAAIPEMLLSGGDRLRLGAEVVLEVLSPPPQKFRHTVDDVNNNALVLRLTFREFSLLLTSDAEREALDRLVREQPDSLSATVLQVPHHGSRRAMSDGFVEAVGARAAVISVGSNTYGHPHAEALLLLAQNEAAIFRTDRYGAVTIRSDGYGWQLRPQPATSEHLESRLN